MTVPLINCQSDADADGKTGQANLKTLNRQMPFHEMPVFFVEKKRLRVKSLEEKFTIEWICVCPLLATDWSLFWHIQAKQIEIYLFMQKRETYQPNLYVVDFWIFGALQSHKWVYYVLLPFRMHNVFSHKYNCATCIQLTCYYHPAMCEIGMLI